MVFSCAGTICVWLFLCNFCVIYGRSRGYPVTRCKRISPFYGGDVTYTKGRKLWSNAFYRCDDAFSLFPSDVDYSNCTERLEWKPDPPKCLKKAEVKIPNHGHVCGGKDHILLHSESYTVCCDSGHELYSDRYLEKTRVQITNNNGSLEPTIPECVEARCDPSAHNMTNVQYMNGSNVLAEFPSRTDVLLSCQDGYAYYRGDRPMKTQLKRTCIKGSIKKAPACKEARCLFAGYPSNRDTYHRVYLADARFIADDQYLEPGQKIEVFCHQKKQYELYVNATQTYLEEFTSECKYGQFDKTDDEFPLCEERRCSFNESSEVCFLMHDKDECKSSNFTIPSRSSVHMRCKDGYRRVRSEDGLSVETNEDALIPCHKGDYSLAYTCIPEPCSVPTVNHARLLSKNASTYDHREKITFLCNNGFHFNGTSSNKEEIFETTCNLGKWIQTIPLECQPDSCSLSLYTGISFWANLRMLTEENGIIQTFENGTKLQIECQKGYKMKDLKSGRKVVNRRNYATCLLGNWTHQYTCNSGPCSVPNVTHARLQRMGTNVYRHMEKITFLCDTGFHVHQNISAKVSMFETICNHGHLKDDIPSECKPDGCKLDMEEGSKYYLADNTAEITVARLMEHATTVRLQCREMFDLFDENDNIFRDKDYMPAATCYRGKWNNKHFCKKRCTVQNVTNGMFIKAGKNMKAGENIAHGESVHVEYSDRNLARSMKCHNGEWHYSTDFFDISSISTPITATNTMPTNTMDNHLHGEDAVPENNRIQNELNIGCKLSDDPRYTYLDSADLKTYQPGSFILNGSTLRVTCTTLDLYEYYTGYDYDYDANSTSEATIVCLNNTLFHPDLDCPEVQVTPDTCLELQHGTVREEYEYFIVSCDKGYSLDLIVPERPQCTCENGQLISVYGGQAPACIPDKCVVPYEIDGRLSLTDRWRVSLSGGSVVEIGDHVYFNCSKAAELKYEPMNRRFECINGLWIEAERDRNWKLGNNGEFPTCREAICTPNCTNGGVCFKDDSCRCKHLTEGKQCEIFICDQKCSTNGGKCVGPGKCSCPAERFGPNCEQKGCILPKQAANHQGLRKSVSPGTTLIKFSCDRGYVLSSENGMTCRVDGSWSEIVTCIKGCTLPSHAAGYKDWRPTFSPGETLNNFVCGHGYVLSSGAGMTCQSNGSWSEIVTCVKGCIIPSNAAKHRNRQTIFSPGETLNSLFCDSGYILSSQNGMTCGNDGLWSEIVTCEKGCKLPNNAAKLRNRRTNFSPGETLNSLFCDSGYVLSSPNGMTCQHDGSWSEIIRCIKGCILPRNAAQHRDRRTVYRAEETLNSFYCDPGYILSSQNGMTCRQDGSWSEIVTCIKGSPTKCKYNFDAGHKWFPHWKRIGRHSHNAGDQLSEDECKQACINETKIHCQSVVYNKQHRFCRCLAVSDESYFTPKRDPWHTLVFILSCK